MVHMMAERKITKIIKTAKWGTSQQKKYFKKMLVKSTPAASAMNEDKADFKFNHP